MTKGKSPTDKAKVTKTERADVLILYPVTFYKCILHKSTLLFWKISTDKFSAVNFYFTHAGTFLSALDITHSLRYTEVRSELLIYSFLSKCLSPYSKEKNIQTIIKMTMCVEIIWNLHPDTVMTLQTLHHETTCSQRTCIYTGVYTNYHNYDTTLT